MIDIIVVAGKVSCFALRMTVMFCCFVALTLCLRLKISQQLLMACCTDIHDPQRLIITIRYSFHILTFILRCQQVEVLIFRTHEFLC